MATMVIFRRNGAGVFRKLRNAPIRTTIQRINEMDSQNHEQIIAETAKGGWKTRLAA